MATKTLYPLDAEDGTSSFLGQMQEDGSAPATATAATGWIVSTTAPTAYSYVNIATERSAGTFGGSSLIDAASGPGATAQCWRSPTAYTGTFAATDWTFAWFMRRDTAGGTADGRVRMRVWKSVNADGSSPTELTSSTQVGATCTNIGISAKNSSITWSPGSVALTAEYLFFMLEWEITGAGGASTDDVHFQIGTSKVTTPDFSTGLNLSASGSEVTLADGSPTYAGAFNAFRGLVLKWP